jgi:hypothetical protein
MAILNNCEIHFAKLDPARPSSKLNKKNPTWELQMRTTDKEQKAEWAAHGIKVTAVREDEEGPILYWRANLRKKSIKADGDKADAPKVVDGKLQPVDPNTIGNGSIGNIRIFQYDYKDKETGVSGKASVLMGLQLTTHILYTPKPGVNNDDDFGETETTVVANSQEDNEESSEETPSVTPSVNPTSPEDEY